MNDSLRELFGSWEVHEGTKPEAVFNFTWPIPFGGTLTVSIYEIANGYEVTTRAEARITTLYETVAVVTKTLEEAIKFSAKECGEWERDFS